MHIYLLFRKEELCLMRFHRVKLKSYQINAKYGEIVLLILPVIGCLR